MRPVAFLRAVHIEEASSFSPLGSKGEAVKGRRSVTANKWAARADWIAVRDLRMRERAHRPSLRPDRLASLHAAICRAWLPVSGAFRARVVRLLYTWTSREAGTVFFADDV
ncbi:hypothetical protein MRX96_019251 [Rhipicephalus microplus]